MLPRTLVNEIEKELPYLILNFGGVENFITYLKQSLDIGEFLPRRGMSDKTYQRAMNYVYTLLTHALDTVIISPWAITVDLTEIQNGNIITKDSIDIEEPYTIHDIDGNLLYTVKDHKGFFGHSRLDRLLINNSVNTDAYFLKYKKYDGSEKIKLLVVNLFSRQILVQNDLLETVDSINQSNITIANFSSLTTTLYIFETVPILPPNLTDIQTLGEANIIQPNSTRSIVPSSGMWLYMEHTDAQSIRTQITNVDNDILIPVDIQPSISSLYYLGLNISTPTLNRLFGLNLAFSDRRVDEIIEIRGLI